MDSLVCPHCNDADATVSLNLKDGETCECGSCGEEFTPAEAVDLLRGRLEAWEAIARWVEHYPLNKAPFVDAAA